MNKYCHLVVTFGNNNWKACADGHPSPGLQGLEGKTPGSQQMSSGRSWKNSKQGRRSRGQSWEAGFNHTVFLLFLKQMETFQPEVILEKFK